MIYIVEKQFTNQDSPDYWCVHDIGGYIVFKGTYLECETYIKRIK